MNKRLAITAQKAIGKGKLLWFDCYNDAIYQDIAPTIKTNYYQEQMHFLMEQGEINETQIPQQDYPKMKTDKMLNVITLFSGYDSQCLALNRLGIPYDLAAWCEIDRHAITAHNALFPQWKDSNLGDVSKVDWAEWHKQHPQPIDLLTYSSPCQDFSSAGLQRGGEEGSGTRSGLLWETERAVRELRPRHLVFENVGGLVSDKFIDLFNRWQARLNKYGYTNFQQLMNAKDYGVPQNRLLIFMVSILDCDRAYYFPKPFKLEKRLKDVLEQNVDERYYLKEGQVAKLVSSIDKQVDDTCIINRPHGYFKGDINKDYSPTVIVSDKNDLKFVAEPQINTLGQLSSSQNSRIIGTEGISPAVINGEKDGMPKIVEPQVLGWTRNEKGEITERHPVNVANCVTAAKRDNTQNYVMEPTICGLPHGHYEGDLYTEYAPAVKSSAYAANNPLIVPQATKEGYAVVPEGGVFDASYPDSKTRRGRVQEGGTVSPTIMASQNELLRYEGIRIRRLSERELYRLMDVSEPDIDTLLAAPIPRTQHAKLAGNSIVVSCLYYIFKNIFVNTEPEAGTQIKLF